MLDVTNGSQNCNNQKPLEITATSGYLASVVTAETGRGSENCPWLIRGVEGQTLNVTLLDFGVWSRNTDVSSCLVYAKLKSSTMPAGLMICGTATTEVQIYSNKGKQDLTIEVFNSTASPDPVYFLIHFQG